MPEIATYADYFIGGAGQLPIILATFGVLAGLAAVGRLMYGGKGFSEADLFGGWAMAVFVFTIGNIFFRIPFNYLFWVMAAIAAGAALWLLVRERLVGASGFWRALILIAPLLLIASARMASEWDEFSHWLPTERFIFNAQGFPFGGRAVAGGHFPGYPYAWLLLLYMANMLAGQLVEAAGSVMNILLLLVFGIGAVRLWNEATDRPMPPVAVLGWTGALFAVAAATVLNPTFVQKVVMTTYADPSTAASVGVGTVLAYFILDALVSKDPAKARTLAWQFGFVMAVLINIKQSNLVLVVMLLGGVSLVALRDPAIRLSAFIRLLPAMMVPAVLIYLIWRYHVGVNLPGGVEASFQPYEKWNLDLLWPIMQRMLLIASKKLGYFAVMGVAVFIALRGLWRCETRFDRLAMLIGFSFLGYNAFLYLIFVTHFSEYDALRAASYWRYNHHLGLMAVAFGAFGLGTLWRRYILARPLPRLVLGVLCAVVLVAPFVFAEKLRFDLEHPKPFYRTVGHELPGLMPVGSRLLILDPRGTGESAVLTQFEMAERQNEFQGYAAQYHDFSKSNISKVFEATKPTHLLVHSFRPVINEVLGIDLPEKGFSFLLRKTDDVPATWAIVKKWSRSDSHWDGR